MTETDALVIGAGPVGLFQAFQLGLQEVRTEVVDALPHAGGQCAELYADKPIYDIPGIPVCSGRELTDRLLRQLAPFRTPLHLGQQIQTIQRQADGRWRVRSDRGTEWLTQTVVIAAGVGAFVARKVSVPELAVFEEGPDAQVHYHAVEAAQLDGRHVVVMGGEDSALETVQVLADRGRCASLTLLHRTDRYKAEPDLIDAVLRLADAGRLRRVMGQPLGLETHAGRLAALRLATADTADGDSVPFALDVLLPRLGLSPKLGPIADWGLDMERKQIPVDTERFATREPGVFAVGDINTYPGKRKLIVCGFHEATLAAFAVGAQVFPDRRQLLQYTTTSPRLHELLGIAPPRH